MASTASRKRFREKLYQLQLGRCWLCDDPMAFGGDRNADVYATFDHVVPRALGGSNRQTNLKLAHKLCNEKRGSKHDGTPEAIPAPVVKKKRKMIGIGRAINIRNQWLRSQPDTREWVKVYKDGKITIYEPATAAEGR